MKKRINAGCIVFLVLAILTTSFIIYQSCLNGDSSRSWSTPVSDFINQVFNGAGGNEPTLNGEAYNSFQGFIRKSIGHFSLFLIDSVFITLFFYFLEKWKVIFKHNVLRIVTILGIGLLVAGISEIIQLFVPGRSGSIIDVLIDFLGYGIGFLIVVGIYYLIEYIKRKNSSKNGSGSGITKNN